MASPVLAVEERIRAAFQAFDVDGSGSISVDELRTVLQTDVPGGTRMSEQDIEALVKDFDANGDGELQYEEFALLWSPLLEDVALQNTRMVDQNAANHIEAANPGSPQSAATPGLRKSTSWTTNFPSLTRTSSSGDVDGRQSSFRKAVKKLHRGSFRRVAPRQLPRGSMQSSSTLVSLAGSAEPDEPRAASAMTRASLNADDALNRQPLEIRVGAALLQLDVAKAAGRGSKSALAELVRGWDISGNNQLSLGELRLAIRKSLKVRAAESEIQQLFRRYDADNGGYLDLSELEPFLKVLLEAARKHEVQQSAVDEELPIHAEIDHRAAYRELALAASEAMRQVEEAEEALERFDTSLPLNARLGVALHRRRQKLDLIIKRWPGASVGYADLASVIEGFKGLEVPGGLGPADLEELTTWYEDCQAEGVKRAICRLGGGIHLKSDLGHLLKEGKTAATAEASLRDKVQSTLVPATEMQQRLLLMEKQAERKSVLMVAKAEDVDAKGRAAVVIAPSSDRGAGGKLQRSAGLRGGKPSKRAQGGKRRTAKMKAAV